VVNRANTIGVSVEVIERPFSYKMRCWDIFLGDEHIGVMRFNKESENISYTMCADYAKYKVNYIERALNMVKSQLIEEVLLGDI
jgi:hypothetical protein